MYAYAMQTACPVTCGLCPADACVDAPDQSVPTATDNQITSCEEARTSYACDNVRCLLPVEMYLALLVSTQYSH